MPCRRHGWRSELFAGHSERSEESRSGPAWIEDEEIRARFFAEFTLSTQSEILRCAQDDSEWPRMTVVYREPE